MGYEKHRSAQNAKEQYNQKQQGQPPAFPLFPLFLFHFASIPASLIWRASAASLQLHPMRSPAKSVISWDPPAETPGPSPQRRLCGQPRSIVLGLRPHNAAPQNQAILQGSLLTDCIFSERIAANRFAGLSAFRCRRALIYYQYNIIPSLAILRQPSPARRRLFHIYILRRKSPSSCRSKRLSCSMSMLSHILKSYGTKSGRGLTRSADALKILREESKYGILFSTTVNNEGFCQNNL